MRSSSERWRPSGLSASWRAAERVSSPIISASEVNAHLFVGKGNPISGDLHIDVRAPSREAVDAFYPAALAAGGVDNKRPSIRSHYHADYCAALVITPDSCNLEAVNHLSKQDTQRADEPMPSSAIQP